VNVVLEKLRNLKEEGISARDYGRLSLEQIESIKPISNIFAEQTSPNNSSRQRKELDSPSFELCTSEREEKLSGAYSDILEKLLDFGIPKKKLPQRRRELKMLMKSKSMMLEYLNGAKPREISIKNKCSTNQV